MTAGYHKFNFVVASKEKIKSKSKLKDSKTGYNFVKVYPNNLELIQVTSYSNE